MVEAILAIALAASPRVSDGMSCSPPPDSLAGVVALMDLLAYDVNGTTGDADVDDRLSDLYDSLPECLTDAGAGQPDLVLSSDATFNAYYHTDADPSTPGNQPTITMFSGIILGMSSYDGAADAAAAYFCTSRDVIDAWVTDPQRVLAHEAAHHYHLNGTDGTTSNEDLLKEFLAIRYDAAMDSWKNDPEVQRIMQELAVIEGEIASETDPDEIERLEGERCAKVAELQAIYDALGLISRFPGDMHAADSPSEYIAMAVETLLYDPAEFCASLNEEEIAWLKTHMGACIEEIAAATGKTLPDCYTNAEVTP